MLQNAPPFLATTTFALPSPSQPIFLLFQAVDCSFSYKIRRNYIGSSYKNQGFLTLDSHKDNIFKGREIPDGGGYNSQGQSITKKI
jgi:hypothetical protein